MTLGLRGRLTLWGIALAVVPLLAVSAIVARLSARELRAQVDAALASRAATIASVVQSSVFDPLARDNPLHSWLELPGLDDPRRCADALAAAAGKSRILAGAAVLDPSGKVVCVTPAVRGAALQQGQWLSSAADGALSSAGIVHLQNDVAALALALGAPGARHLVVAFYRWEMLAQLVDDALAQARTAGGTAQIASDGTIVYDAAHAMLGAALQVPRGQSGVLDAADTIAAWARNDVAPTDPGGGFTYLFRVPREAATATVRTLVRALAVTLVVAVLLSVLAAWALAQRVLQPVARLSVAVDRIVREGDLSQKIEVAGDDELGRLAASFRAMVGKLREIPLSLDQSVRVLSEVVAQLSSSAGTQRETVARQAAALQQTQVTAQEIRQTSALAADKAQAVLQAVDRAAAVGESGEAAVQEGVAELARIQDHVATISARIAHLGESTRRIGDITGTVKDLADQSNMLALNAAIEAVRSGEHGKGFGVVAREIRSLADQSIQATQRVRENLDQIGDEVKRAVAVADQGHAGVNAGLTRVRGSGDSLRELSAITRQNAQAVRQIAAAVSQQGAGIEQVFAAVRELSSQMDEIVRVIDASGEAVDTLGSISQRIVGIVGSFRV